MTETARTGRGVHYRWDGRIGFMDGHGSTRSMSRKAPSPDSAAEGLFGRLEVEMCHGAGWERRAAAELETEFAEHMGWHNRERVEVSLGSVSPCNYRKSLEIVA